MNCRGWLNAQQRQLPLQLLQQQVIVDICEHCQRAAVDSYCTTTTTAAENVWASDLLPLVVLQKV